MSDRYLLLQWQVHLLRFKEKRLVPAIKIDTSEENKGSLKLCTAFGISVYVHWSFAILIVWLINNSEDKGTEVMIGSLLFTLAVFGCVVLHEFGHALTAKLFNIKTKSIILLPFLGFARLERNPDDPKQEFWIALAGPAVNMAIAFLLWGYLSAKGAMPDGFKAMLLATEFLPKLLLINAVLAAFNVVPAFPMDGGRVLRALLGLPLDYVLATKIAAWLGQAFALFLGLYAASQMLEGGSLFHGISLAAVGIFIWFGADEEVRQAPLRKLFKGIFVKDVMLREVRTVSQEARVDEIVEELADETLVDFAVLAGQRVVGVLTRDTLIQALTEFEKPMLVKDIMHKDVPLLEDYFPLEVAFQREREARCPSFPVLHEGKLVGMLMLSLVKEQLMANAPKPKPETA